MKIKSQASDAADLVIAAAAAEILKTAVSIDEISIDDIATEAVLAAPEPSAADFEAIQQAYAMLDLSPLTPAQRKEGTIDNVYEAVEKASLEPSSPDETKVPSGATGSVSRTERGTIEMATHAGGRQLIPQYNFCGMLIRVAMSDGLSFIFSEEKNIWQMIEQSGKVMVSGIKSVTFDKPGNLSYVTKRGDTVTLKVDGTIDTKFAKKLPVEVPQEVAESASVLEQAPALAEPEGSSLEETVTETGDSPAEKTQEITAADTSEESPEITAAETSEEPTTKTPAKVKQSKSDAKAKGAKPSSKSSPKSKKKGR